MPTPGLRVSKRSLDGRIEDYLSTLEQTIKSLTQHADMLEASPEMMQAVQLSDPHLISNLREVVRVQALILTDLEDMLAGYELNGFVISQDAITGEISHEGGNG